MWDVQTALEVVRTAVAAAIGLYFLGAQFREVETRRRNETPFIWLLAGTLLVSVSEVATVIVRAGGLPEVQPMAVAILYILAPLMQVDHL